MNITYLGDDIYYGSRNSTGFTVTDRIVSELGFDKPVFVVDVASVVNVSSNFPAGELFVYVDGVKQDAGVIVSGGKAKINLPGLSAGNHSVLVTFDGDYDYTNLTTSFDIFVEKYNSTVNVSASSVRTGNPVIVDVNASGNGSANIVIFNGTGVVCEYNITISNGKGYLQVPYSFVDGSYSLNITYLGDDIYYGSRNSTGFTVTDRIVSELGFDKPVFVVDVASVVNVSSNFPAGELFVYVDGVKQDAGVIVSGGKAKINLPGLSAGNHSVLVTFDGDYDYTNLTTSFDIFVEKYNSTVNVSASSVRTGNPVIVDVNASGNGSANIVIFNSTDIICEYDIVISNGKGYLQVPYAFPDGDYNLNITYNGDDIYYGSKNTTAFAVHDRINSTLNIDKFNFIVNTPDVITVSSNFQSGTVSVYIDGSEVDDITISDFEGTINLNPLTFGNHTILLMYSGNYNYTNLTALFNISVFKLNSTINVSATNVRTGNNIIIYMNASGDGIANIVIYNESEIIGEYNATISEGKGSFIVPYDFAEGSYLVNVTYLGDDTYYGSFNVTDFIVSDKIFSTLTLDKQDVIVNTPDVLVVSANFKSGTLNVYVDGVRHDDINIVNNKSEIHLDGLTVGEHNILLIYGGDYNYSSLTTSFSIRAHRYNSTVKVTGNDEFIYNNSIPLDITLNNTSTDADVPDAFVTVTVYYANGSVAYNNFEVGFTNEAVEHIVSDLMAGDYYVIVTYPGNENFTGNASERLDFTIHKASTSVTANVNDSTFNDVVTVEYVIHNDDNTGAVISNENVIIKIYNKAGNLVYETESASFKNMIGSFSITDHEFVAGNYTVNVTYSGNENFTGNYVVTTFEVSKARAAVSVNVNSTTFNQTVVVDYSLSNINNTNARIPDGNVNINIVNKANGMAVYADTSAFINEKGVLTITGFEFASGSYSATVSYDGDENFIGNSTTFDFTVSRARTAVSVNVNNITFNQNVIIEYELSNINGTNAHIPDSSVDIEITSKATGAIVYTGSSSFAGEKGVLEIADFEFASGNYIANVIYNGNENFTGNSSKFIFSVSRARTAVSANVNNTTFNQNVIVEYELSNDNITSAHIPDGNVIVSIANKANGRTVYTCSSSFAGEKGLLKITDFEFGAGNYVVTVSYDGNANFTGNSTKFDFTVSRARTAVSVNVNNTTFNQNVVVEYAVANVNGTAANIPDSKVSINITDKASGRIVYSNNKALFTNEKGVLEITNFEFASCDYSVSVGYAGNDNFTGNSTTFDFSVFKARTAISVNVSNITFNQKVIIDFNLSNDNATSAHIPNSKVTINIIDKDTNYNVYNRDVYFTDEKGTLEIIDFEFAAGNYTVNATYAGNDNFIGSSILSDFTVFKARTAVSVNVNNITFNQNVVVEYNLTNINGTSARIPNSNVNINIINKKTGVSVYNVNSSFNKEKGVLTITDFEFNAGNYSVTVTYAGNENFTGNSTEFDFTVLKARTSVSVKVNGTIFNQTVVIEYALSNADGTGAHIPDSDVTIKVTDKKTGRNVYTNVSSFVNEKGVLRINDFEFAGGNYTVTVAYAGNDNFIGNSTKSDFTVSKARTDLSAIIDNTVFNEDVVVKYNLSNADATGAHIPDSQVTINIVNAETGQSVYSKMSSFTNEEGILNITEFDFAAGNYIANITYAGNANFTDNSISVPFTVSKAHTNVSVNVNNITFNQNAVVEYNLENIDGTSANIPDGNVVINVTAANNRKVIYSADASFVNGKGVFNSSNYEFAAGNYTVTVIYNGNENFTGNSTKFNFTVSKANTGILVNVNSTVYNRTVVIEYNLSNINGTSAHIPDGRVTVTVVNKLTGAVVYSSTTASFTDEYGTLPISSSKVPAGEYTVNVSYAGNANFTDSSASFDFMVYKARTQVYADVNDTTFNQNVVIAYNLENIEGTDAHIPNSNVLISVRNIQGDLIYNTTDLFVREKGMLNISNYEFNAGEYTLEVAYNGNDNFEGSSSVRTFRVFKARTEVSAKVNNVTYDQNIVVEYTLNNANGTSAHIPDGYVDVSIIEKSTGRIIYNELSYFVNEEGTLTTANSHFASGDYTVSVEYMGSENFFGNNSLFNFTVYKAHSSVSVNVNNTVFNNAVAVEYALDNVDTNASVPMGNVTVKIINKENSEVIYTGISSFADEKGILYINDFEFAVGEYTANVTYEGSNNFIGSSAASDFIVSKAHTLIVSHASSVIFNNDVIFSVNVINTDTRAVLNKSLEMVTVDIDGDNGYSYHCISSIYDANKAFSNLGAGKYNATVKYNGGSNFLASNDVRFSFTVSRANTSSAVSADNVTYNNTVTVYGEVYNLNTSASVSDYDLVNVSVYNDGEIVYSANVTVGSLRSGYVLPLLDAGEYGVTAYYYNSENFTESIADAEFSISKANSLIQFIDDYVVMGNNLSFSVVNISDGSTITLKVNNRTYTGSVVDGVGYVLIDSGDSGTFNNVLVTFDGDNNYNPSNSTGTVKFIRSDSFTALQLLIDENTDGNLVFNNDFVFDSNTDDVNGVKVNKSINIDGNGYVLDASGASSMFDVTADNVNIANTAICNVDVSDNGNVIAWSGGDGSINNVAFENNNIDNGNVISIDADNVTINNSRFTNNSGINCDVISIEDAENTIISNSVFEDNTIANGAVIDIAGCEKTSISNSDFTNNNVAGGVIIEIAESGDTSIDNTSFAGNDLTSNSIAVDVADSNNTNIEGLNFTDNTVSRNSTLLNIDNAKSVNLTDVKFDNDNASGDSSIAAIDDSSDVKVNGLNIDSCKVDGSNSIMTIDDSEVNISNSLMTNNAADKGNVVTIDLDSEVYLDNVATLNNSNNNQHCDITYETYVEINSSDIHVGENAMVDVNVITSYPYDVKGILVITANGDKYYFTLTDDEGSFPISGLKEGRYNISAVYMGNKYIDNTFSNPVMINVFKVDDFNFTADNTVITTSESLVMNLPSDASGNVTVVAGNETIVVPVVNGKAIVNGDKLPLGVNNLKASYSGDDKYVSKDLSDVISVKCDNYDIAVENNDLTYGDNLVIELPEGTTGQINVTVGNKSLNVPINEGKAVISADDLPLGYSNVTVSYGGNDKYVPGNMSETIRVRLGNYTMDVDSDIVVSGDDLVVNLPDDASGNVSVVIGNETFVVPVVDGKANISTDNLSIDDYNISISYSGDDKYVPKDITSNISIVSDIVVTAPDVNKYYGGPERFVVNVADIKGKGIPDKNVTVIINNITYSRITNEYGNISLPVNLPSGEYIALIKVDDKLYNASVTVNPTIIGHDFIKVYMNDSQFYVTVYGTDGNYLPEGSLVVFNINGVFYKRTADSEGRVKLNINLPQGTYIITSNNTVTGEVCSNNVTVISKIINNYDVVKYYCNGTHYYVTLLDDLGNPVGAGVSVTFNINGVFYTRSTNASGVAKLNINLPEGDYVITADYDGCVVSNNVKVLPVLTAEDLVKTYGTRDKFVVNVFDGQGNPYPGQAVSFNINGVFYTRTSDANGQAMLNINLPVGEYIITSSYNGTSISNKVTVVE